jgi:serine protease inhibitor
MTLSSWCRTLVPAVLLLTSCKESSAPDSAPGKLEALPRQLSVAEQKLIAGNNAFAFDLFKTLNATQRSANVFVSPISASMALGMTMNGANGTTFEAMRHALRLDNASREEINQGYKSLIALLRGLDKSVDFRIANSIWYDKTFPFKSDFIGESQSSFDAVVKPVDFDNESATLGAINGWVNDATNKKIPTILDDIDPSEVMFLINAMYFKGSWTDQFDKSKTADAPFHLLDGSTAMVPTMTRTGPVRSGFTNDYSVVDLPYGNTAFTMTIIVPREGLDVNTVAESLTAEKWSAIDKSTFEGERLLYMPRFKLDWERKLNDDLAAMGMGIAFTDAADFSRLSDIALELSRVIQKTYVDVNEEGTEAAAVTVVGVVPVSAPGPIRVDRPFIFAIRERLSGTILFMGKIVKLPA